MRFAIGETSRRREGSKPRTIDPPYGRASGAVADVTRPQECRICAWFHRNLRRAASRSSVAIGRSLSDGSGALLRIVGSRSDVVAVR